LSHPIAKQSQPAIASRRRADWQNLVAVEPGKRDAGVTIEPFSLWVLAFWGLIFFFAGFGLTHFDSQFTAPSVDRAKLPQPQSTSLISQPAAASAAAVQSTAADAAAPAVLHVAMKNMKFEPATIEVKSGDTVEWTNEDITPHTVTSASFDSASIDSDKSWRHTFTVAGSFPYGCTFHPDMKGVVVVK
jgi:plastocyanin